MVTQRQEEVGIKKYLQFTFRRETVRDWKTEYQENFESHERVEFFGEW